MHSGEPSNCINSTERSHENAPIFMQNVYIAIHRLNAGTRYCWTDCSTLNSIKTLLNAVGECLPGKLSAEERQLYAEGDQLNYAQKNNY